MEEVLATLISNTQDFLVIPSCIFGTTIYVNIQMDVMDPLVIDLLHKYKSKSVRIEFRKVVKIPDQLPPGFFMQYECGSPVVCYGCIYLRIRVHRDTVSTYEYGLFHSASTLEEIALEIDSSMNCIGVEKNMYLDTEIFDPSVTLSSVWENYLCTVLIFSDISLLSSELK